MGEIKGWRKRDIVIKTPPTAKAMALAIAAPITPHPAPGIVISKEKSDIRRVGNMKKKLRVTFIKLTKSPTRMGVFVSPAERSTVPKIPDAVLASIGV